MESPAAASSSSSDAEKQKKFKEQLMCLIAQLKKGCPRRFCPNTHCKKYQNALLDSPCKFSASDLRLVFNFKNDEELLKHCVQALQNTAEPATLFCTPKPADLFSDVDAFCTAFPSAASCAGEGSTFARLQFGFEEVDSFWTKSYDDLGEEKLIDCVD